MRKKISLILVVALAVILAVSLIACNRDPQEVAPQVDPSENATDIESQASKIELRFSMPYANSVFNAVYIGDFDLSEVKYYFAYLDDDGSELSVKEVGVLSEDMIEAADLPLLRTPGKHTIRVNATTDKGKTVTGKFQLRLKSDTVTVRPVELRFELDEGTIAYFGREAVQDSRRYAVIEVDEGTEFASWAEFTDSFRFGKEMSALVSVSYGSGGGAVTLSATSDKFPFTIGQGPYVFRLSWTLDIVTVKFDLNLPEGAEPIEGEDPLSLFEKGGEYYNVSVRRDVGAVNKPDTAKFNFFAGLHFAGWYLPKYTEDGKVDTYRGQVKLDRMWDFSKTVGNNDITLYAKWSEHSYSYTIYPMGGGFKGGLTASKKDNTEITLSNYEDLGYKLLTSETRFTNGGALMRLSFDGFAYGDSYEDYVAEVTVDPSGKKVMLLFSEIYSSSNRVFDKNSACLKFGGLYEDYTCVTAYRHDFELGEAGAPNKQKPIEIKGDRVGYIGWQLDESLPNALDSYLDQFFVMTVKADGVRIDSTKDKSVNVIKIPAQVTIDGAAHPITEIGERAITNLKALREVDLSQAANLTTIGKEAFAFDTNLQTIIQPDGNTVPNNITIVGKNAFDNTAYEERYTSISGLDFIIINKLIYKYTGTPDENGVIDLTVQDYYTEEDFADLQGVDPAVAAEGANAQLKAATHIMDGAFESAKDLVEIRLDEVFQDIEAGAFSGATKLKKLTVPENNALKYVSEDAFDGCDVFFSEAGGNYNAATGAILIGNIYYYQAKRDVDTVNVPASYSLDDKTYTISMIAPRAFYGCEALGDVTFEEESNITNIGADAFQGTAYSQNNRYLVINGILAEFYGPSVRNGSVPSDVTEIAENAFGYSAGYLQTVTIPETVKTIRSYAFKGATSLKAVILSSATVDGKKLSADKAPSIELNAFANKSGVMNDELKIYFSKNVLDLLKDPTADVTDAKTSMWVELYKLNEAKFDIETISSVAVREGRLTPVLLDNTAKELDAEGALKIFKEKYQDDESLKTAIAVYSNTGAEVRYEELKLDQVTFAELSSEKAATLDKDGKHFLFVYEYNKNYPDVFPNKEDKPGALIISFYKAVKGNNKFDNADPYPYSRYNNKAGDMWIEGLGGKDEGKEQSGQRLPTFFTSQDKSKLTPSFKYKDVAGVEHTIAIDVNSIYGFALNEEVPAKTVEIEIDFHGLGTYTFSYTYSAVKAKYNAIDQTEPITVPLNADVERYIENSKLDLIGEDGLRTQFYITSADFAIYASDLSSSTDIPSEELGHFTFSVNFKDVASCVQNLSADIVYSVVLEADPSDFSFEISSNRPVDIGEKHYDGTARIVGYAKRDAITAIIPETYVVGEKTYVVTEIGRIASSTGSDVRGVFEGCTKLQTVYLTNNIRNIGTRTFAGCVLLRNVMTATASSIAESSLSKGDMTPIVGLPDIEETLGGKQVLIRRVTLNKISNNYTPIGDEYLGLAIPSEFDAGEKDAKTKLDIIYRITRISDDFTLPARSGVDENKPIYLYIPATICNELAIKDHDGSPISENSKINVVFYQNKYEQIEEDVYQKVSSRFVVDGRINAGLISIGNNAFMNCTSLEFAANAFSRTTLLQYLGVGAFSGSGIESIDLTRTKITEVNSNLFDGCAALTTVKLPSGVTEILQCAFRNCYLLNSISAADALKGVAVIANNAFDTCRSLREFTLGVALETGEIGESAFVECPALIIKCDFAMPASAPKGWNTRWNSGSCPVIYSDKGGLDANGNAYVEKYGVRYMIASSAISGADKVATVITQAFDLSEAVIVGEVEFGAQKYTVTSIADRAFEGNSRLVSVSLDYRVATIGSFAFKDCTSLAEFKFVTEGQDGEGDNGIISIGQDAFDGCKALAVKPTIPTEVIKGDFKFRLDRSDGTAVITGLSNVGAAKAALTVEDTVTYAGREYKIVAIGESAFYGNGTMTSITLGANVATIGSRAFYNCSQLASVTATANLKTIDSEAFASCAQLKTFEGATGLTFVADNAFDEGCECKPTVA